MEDKKKNIVPLGITIGGYTFQAPVVKDGFTTFEGVMDIIIFGFNTLVGLSALVAIFMIVYGGYTLILASGDPEKIQKGWGAIQAAIVGMVIVFLARTVVLFLLDNILK